VSLAGRFEGLIQLGTVCVLDESEPRPEFPLEAREGVRDFAARVHPEDRDDPRAAVLVAQSDPAMDPDWKAPSRQYDERVRKRLSGHPGRAYELFRPDGSVDSHLVDAVFMEYWMKDREFHIE